MFSTIQIQGFRGLADVKLEGLRRVNLLVGRNNVGKTSALEAILLLDRRGSIDAVTRIAKMREGATGKDLLPSFVASRCRTFFTDMRESTSTISCEDDVRPAFTLQLSIEGDAVRSDSIVGTEVARSLYRPNDATGRFDSSGSLRSPHHEARLVSDRSFAEVDIDDFTTLIRDKRDEELFTLLRVLEPDLQRIQIGSSRGHAELLVDLGKPQLLPLSVCGQGLVHLCSLAVELMVCRGGVLLADDLDAGLHHSAFDDVLHHLVRLAQQLDVQVFATTHNDELLRAIREEDIQELALYRFDRVETGVRVVRYADDVLLGALEGNIEVRG